MQTFPTEAGLLRPGPSTLAYTRPGSCDWLWRRHNSRRWQADLSASTDEALGPQKATFAYRAQRCKPFLRLALEGLQATPAKLGAPHDSVDTPLLFSLHKVIREQCIFQERRLAFDSLVQILNASGSMASVFHLILSFELSGHPAAKPPNMGIDFSGFPPGLFSIVSRGTALSTELFCAWGKQVGTRYLISALKPVIQGLLRSRTTFSLLEAATTNEEDQEEKKAVIIASIDTTVESVLDSLLESVHLFPLSLKNALLVVRAVSNCLPFAFPGVDLPFVCQTSFLLSKFILPAILNPEQYGVVDTVPGEEPVTLEQRRKLIVLVKVMANMILNTPFQALDPEYFPLNFIITDQSKRDKVSKLLDKCTVLYEEEEPSGKPSWASVQSAIQFLHRIIDQKWDTMKDILTKDQFKNLENQMGEIQLLLNLHSSSAISHCVVAPTAGVINV